MSNIKSINGNPIVVGTSGIEDGSVTDIKLASGGVVADIASLFGLVDAIVSGGYPSEALFEKGSIMASTGANDGYRSSCRMRTKGKVKLPYSIKLSSEVRTGILYTAYDDNGDIVDYTQSMIDLSTRPVVLSNSYSYRMAFDGRAGQSEATMTISAIYANISIEPSDIYTLIQVYNMLSNGSSLPSYYHDDDYIDNKALSVQQAANVDGISFGFISDVHTGNSSLTSMVVAKYLADNTSAVPFMLFGGDVPTTQVGSEDGLDRQAMLWQNMMADYGKHRVYSCRGNHDYLGRWSGGGTGKSYGACMSYVMGYGPDNIVRASGNTFTYYFDDSVHNTRFIVFDLYGATSDEPFSGYAVGTPEDAYWLCDLLHDSDGMNVILLSHEPLNIVVESSATEMKPYLSLIGDVIGAFAQKTTVNVSYGATTIDEDFTQDTGVLVCALSGHAHRDYSSTNKGFLTIGITCDALYTEDDGYTKNLGTVTQGAFDVIGIDYINRTIRCTRIGAGNDRSFTY